MVFVCKNGHSDEVAVYPAGDYDVGIVVSRDGSRTNRWEDGTIGITDEQYDDTREETEGICMTCQADSNWRDDVD